MSTNGAAGERAPAPDVVVFLQARADARPRRPVDDPVGRARQRRLRIAHAQVGRQARQAGAEREHLDGATRPDRGVHEQQQRARVSLHRPGHVAQQHELARHLAAAPVAADDRVAGRGERAAHQRPHVQQRAAAMRLQPVRAPLRVVVQTEVVFVDAMKVLERKSPFAEWLF